MAGTTADKLQGIINAKSGIAAAITAKGGTVPSLFEDYGDAITALPSGSTPIICGLNVTPTTSAQTITAPSGTDGYSPVNVSAVDSSIDSNIQAGNIKSGTTILGVTGTYSGSAPVLSGLVVVPSTSAQTITPTSGIDGFNQVNVNAVTNTIDQNITAGNIKSGISILGVTGTYEGGGGGGGDNKLNQLLTKTITTVTAEDMSGVTSIGNNTFQNCSGLTSVTIPDGVTSIGNYAFANCDGLTTVTIPDSVTSIGEYAFQYSEGLTSVTISNSVTSIGNSVFYGCTGLTSITIPDSVTSIGNSVFGSCNGLTSITFGSGLLTIGANNYSNNAFQLCRNCLLFDFRSAQQVPTLTNVNAFSNTNANKKIVVPDALYDTWVATNNWSSSSNGIVGAITKASDYNP